MPILLTLLAVPVIYGQNDPHIDPLKGAGAAKLKVLDEYGNWVSAGLTDHSLKITSTLINYDDVERQFTYIVQIQDENDVVVLLNMQQGSLLPTEKLHPILDWHPNEAGSFTVTVFMWDSIDFGNPWWSPSSTPVDVVDEFV